MVLYNFKFSFTNLWEIKTLSIFSLLHLFLICQLSQILVDVVRSMKVKDENMMKDFWLKPAYQRNSSLGAFWRFTKKRFTIATAALLFMLFIFCACVFFWPPWLDIAKYNGTELKITNKKQAPIHFPLNCTAWILQNNTCPKNYYPVTFKPDPSLNSTCPDYFKWIHEDLRHWKYTGITREMLEKVRYKAHFRLVILDGKIYIEQYRQSIETRALVTMWGIVQLLRFYPGRLPDLELMFDCDDRPIVQVEEYLRPDSGPPPLFRYCSDGMHMDIVFPDWSFWGWPEINIRSWRYVLKDIEEGNKRSKWKDRVPYAYWKGNPYVAPWRKDLMNCTATDEVDWNTRLYIQDWKAEGSNGYKASNLGDQCTHRYKIYIEGWAWSVSEKYIFACDSPVLLITPRYYDFFIRGMMPQQHYWPVRENDKCRSLKFAVEYGNNHTKKAESIGVSGSRFIHEGMKMERVYDYMFHLLNEYAKLLKFKPVIPPNAVELCPECLACPTDEKYRKIIEESLEKSPSFGNPCMLPSPFDPATFRAFDDEKIKSIHEVETWENEYYKNH